MIHAITNKSIACRDRKNLMFYEIRSDRNPEDVGHNNGQCDILRLKRRKKGRSSYREEAKTSGNHYEDRRSSMHVVETNQRTVCGDKWPDIRDGETKEQMANKTKARNTKIGAIGGKTGITKNNSDHEKANRGEEQQMRQTYKESEETAKVETEQARVN